MLGILEDMAQFFHGKTVVCSVYSKNIKHHEETPAKNIVLQRQPFRDVYKKRSF